MADITTVIAKVEQYAKVVAGRQQTWEKFRSEGYALMQQSMLQTQGMVARIMKQADDTFAASEREQKSYYGAQDRERTESMHRLEAAVARRRKALHELQSALEGKGN